MSIFNKTFAIAALALSSLALAGCNQRDGNSPAEAVAGAQIDLLQRHTSTGVYAIRAFSKLSNINIVNCIYIDSSGAGGLSCDWPDAPEKLSKSDTNITINKVASYPSVGVSAVVVPGKEVGREADVRCIYVDSNKAGGLNCNWGAGAPSPSR
jgi:hypothetical protein